LLGHVLFKCFEFLSENKVIIFCTLKFETIDINAVVPLGKVRRTLKICLRNSELLKGITYRLVLSILWLSTFSYAARDVVRETQYCWIIF
jgi:hypothetical protein